MRADFLRYCLPLPCGCSALVTRDAGTGFTLARVIELRAPACRLAAHQPGTDVYLWELLPQHRTGSMWSHHRWNRIGRGVRLRGALD